MDPFTMMASVAGMAVSAYGAFSAASDANKASQASQQISGLESQVNDQRKQAMELSARRQSMEVLRNNQRARSMALNSATNQGAQQGSGLQGGYGQISGQSGVNLLGINQNLEIGRNIFGLDNQINQQKMLISQYQGQEATDQAWSSFGKSLGGSAGTLGNIIPGLGGGGQAGNAMGGAMAGGGWQ